MGSKDLYTILSSLIAATKLIVGLAAQSVFSFLTVPCGVPPQLGSCAVTVRQFSRWCLWRKSCCQTAKVSILDVASWSSNGLYRL